jgi:hypothetical protein
MINVKTLIVTIAAASIALTSCNKKEAEVPKSTEQSLTQGTAPSSVAGIRWEMPDGWTPQPARQMRIVTYAVPSGSDGVEAGECAVFYFGKGEGGAVEPNIARWISQFVSASEPTRSTRTVDGMDVSIVSLTGTYQGMGGPMMPQGAGKEGFRLLGAIIGAPEGSVFFKFTGPTAVVDKAESAFMDMVESVEKM